MSGGLAVDDRLQELEARIADLRRRLPRHSVPPAMWLELEELEEERERLRRIDPRPSSEE